MKLSIIIPMYNCESTIVKCLDSIEDNDDCEVILINDGSIDNTMNVCAEYISQNKNKKISITNIENGGASNARNIGIEKACGEYITFIDSDDYVDKKYTSKVLELIKKDYDYYCFASNIVKGTEIRENKSFNESGKVEIEIFKGILFKQKLSVCTVWSGVFKREILINQNIRFSKEIKMSEDFLFIIEYINNAKKIYYLNECLYNYLINPNGMCSNAKLQYFENYAKVLEKIKKMDLDSAYWQSFMRSLLVQLFRVVGTLKKRGYKSKQIHTYFLESGLYDCVKKHKYQSAKHTCIKKILQLRLYTIVKILSNWF